MYFRMYQRWLCLELSSEHLCKFKDVFSLSFCITIQLLTYVAVYLSLTWPDPFFVGCLSIRDDKFPVEKGSDHARLAVYSFMFKYFFIIFALEIW